MTEPFHELPLASAQHLDGLCRRFELGLGERDPSRLEDYLEGVTGPERTALLTELLALELEYRRKQGEEPKVNDYLNRFSTDRELVAHVWESAGITQQSGSAGGSQGPDGVANTSHSSTELPEVLGFQVLRLLGRGGMGVVYLAEQPSPRRTVALKLIARRDNWEAASRRFRIEAGAIARLQHPNVVEIFEVGERNGQPYLVLE